jgi:hypothetical protein
VLSTTLISTRFQPAAGGSPFSRCPFLSDATMVRFSRSVPPEAIRLACTGFCARRVPPLGFLFCWVRNLCLFHDFLRPIFDGSSHAGQPQESLLIHFPRQNLAARAKPELFSTCSRGTILICLELIPRQSWICFATGFSLAWSMCGSHPSSDFHSSSHLAISHQELSLCLLDFRLATSEHRRPSCFCWLLGFPVLFLSHRF